MSSVSLKSYMMKYLVVVILVVIGLWASVFYAFILDEVYDNVDDGLKNQKILILRKAYEDPDILNTRSYGVNQFKITPADSTNFTESNILSNEFFFMPYDEENEPYRVLRTGFYGPDENRYNLEIRVSTVEEDDLLQDLSIALAVLYLVLILSIFFLNRIVLTKALTPFHKILNNLKDYEIGKVRHLPENVSNVNEFQQLNHYLSEMVDRNDIVFRDQKLFIENASHELQTPLTIIVHKLDLLIENGDLDEDLTVKLFDVKKSISRMVDLNKSLLLISKIENRQFAEVEDISLSKIADDVLASFYEIIDFKNIRVQISNMDECRIQGNETLWHVAISNLIRNAIRYTKPEGNITIIMETHRFSIANTAHTGSLDTEKLFYRFYKGPDQQAGSSGLGLSIVKAIVSQTVGASVSYTFKENFHFFYVEFENS